MMNKCFTRALSVVLCLVLVFAQLPLLAHADEHDHEHSGLVLEVLEDTVCLFYDETELGQWPLEDDVTPSVSMGMIDGDFVLLLQLDKPYMMLFQSFEPEQFTLCGRFDCVTADSTLKSALKLIVEEDSSIDHV